jgi:DNA-binding NarL/FixJ family response regulator
MPTKPTVLTVESEEREAFSLAGAIRNEQWDVISAADAPSAIKIARELRPRVVIISSRVLGGGGLLALRRLRVSAHTVSIPVIGVAGTGMEREALRIAGADEAFPERGAQDEIRKTIERFIADPPRVLEAPAEVIRDPQRLAALSRTRLLDSDPEETYDRMTRMGARLLNVPTILVSLVDHDRQFFKSHFGLADPWATKRQTPLSHSFCQWVVSSGENLVVNDARIHDTLRHNEAVTDLNAIAYAGAVLNAAEGEAVGTLCAIDSKPRKWSRSELELLNDLSTIVEAYVVAGEESAAGNKRTAAARDGVKACTEVLLNQEVEEEDRRTLVATIDDLSRLLR